MKICSIMQPTYLPWIGYFDLIDQSDVFVFYDDVQYVKGQWDSRNRINTSNGEVFLTVPIKKSSLNSAHNEIEIDNSKPWRKKHLKTLFYTYQKATYFKEVYSFIEELLNKEYATLSELNIESVKLISQKIGIENEFELSSTLKSTEGTKDARLVDICKELDSDSYLSPLGASSYIEEKNRGGEFSPNAINLYYQHFIHPEYTQNFGEFKSHMSIVDILFNEGFENTLSIIRKGRNKSFTSIDIEKNLVNG